MSNQQETNPLHCVHSVVPGVIFQTNRDGSLPPHVLYKIRQNSSFTEKTNEIRRAYWRPGPNTGGKFYFLYGFVWIQGRWMIFLYNSYGYTAVLVCCRSRCRHRCRGGKHREKKHHHNVKCIIRSYSAKVLIAVHLWICQHELQPEHFQWKAKITQRAWRKRAIEEAEHICVFLIVLVFSWRTYSNLVFSVQIMVFLYQKALET